MKPKPITDSLFMEGVVKPELMWLILSVAILIFIVFSLILFFHWHRFGKNVLSIGTAEVIYLAVSIFLILGATASIMLF